MNKIFGIAVCFFLISACNSEASEKMWLLQEPKIILDSDFSDVMDGLYFFQQEVIINDKESAHAGLLYGSHAVQRKILITINQSIEIGYLMDIWPNLTWDVAVHLYSELESVYGKPIHEKLKPIYKEWTESEGKLQRVVERFNYSAKGMSIAGQLTEESYSSEILPNSYSITLLYSLSD